MSTQSILRQQQGGGTRFQQNYSNKSIPRHQQRGGGGQIPAALWYPVYPETTAGWGEPDSSGIMVPIYPETAAGLGEQYSSGIMVPSLSREQQWGGGGCRFHRNYGTRCDYIVCSCVTLTIWARGRLFVFMGSGFLIISFPAGYILMQAVPSSITSTQWGGYLSRSDMHNYNVDKILFKAIHSVRNSCFLNCN